MNKYNISIFIVFIIIIFIIIYLYNYNIEYFASNTPLPVLLPPNPMDLFPPSIGPNIVVYIPDITIKGGDIVYLPIYLYGTHMYDGLQISMFYLPQYYSCELLNMTYLIDGDIMGDESLKKTGGNTNESYTWYDNNYIFQKKGLLEGGNHSISEYQYTSLFLLNTRIQSRRNFNSYLPLMLVTYIKLTFNNDLDISITNRLQDFPILIYTFGLLGRNVIDGSIMLNIRNLPENKFVQRNVPLSCYRNGNITDSCCFDDNNELIDCTKKNKLLYTLQVPLLSSIVPTITSNSITTTTTTKSYITNKSYKIIYIYSSIIIIILIVLIYIYVVYYKNKYEYIKYKTYEPVQY
jgi:hypothetical protein